MNQLTVFLAFGPAFGPLIGQANGSLLALIVVSKYMMIIWSLKILLPSSS